MSCLIYIFLNLGWSGTENVHSVDCCLGVQKETEHLYQYFWWESQWPGFETSRQVFNLE